MMPALVPHHDDAERVVLGSILRDPTVVPRVQYLLPNEEPFRLDAHRRIYRALLELFRFEVPIDLVTLSQKLYHNGDMPHIGYDYLARLHDETPTAGTAEHHARVVAEASRRRRLVYAADRLRADADRGVPLSELADVGRQIGVLLDGSEAASPCAAMTDIQAEAISWLWPGYVPAGMVTLLDGDPGLGKSFLTLDLAARLSRGWKMPPDGGREAEQAPADVLLVTAEDDAARVVRPRLEALGADLNRVHHLAGVPDRDGMRPVVLPDDLPLLCREMLTRRVRLLVLDPLMAFLSGRVDAHRDSDVRRVLYRLKALAEVSGAAIVIVRHLNKLTYLTDPIYRGGGSIGIIGAARSALLLGRHPDDDNQRVLAGTKSNIAPLPPSLAFGITFDHNVAKLGWTGQVDLKATDLLARKGGMRSADSLEAAKELLLELLEHGPRPAAELVEAAKHAGISYATLKRAREALHIEASKDGYQGPWSWRLPPKTLNKDPNELLCENRRRIEEILKGVQRGSC